MELSTLEAEMSVRARGKTGFSIGLGFGRFGYSRFGAPKSFGGIYAKYYTLDGPRILRVRFMRPTNPQTTAQQNWRSNLASGWSVYNSLTDAEKKSLSTQARRYRLSGPQLFMSRYLKSLAT